MPQYVGGIQRTGHIHRFGLGRKDFTLLVRQPQAGDAGNELTRSWHVTMTDRRTEMSVRRRIGLTAATITAVGAGLLGVPATASAASVAPASLYNCTYKYVTGSLGHKGAAVTCQGGSNDYFRGVIDCKRFDNGYVYRHWGPIVRAGQTSTVWCDYNAKVVFAGYTPA
ncbi:hypothetical protein [Streptomyces thermolineatus]|uniref:hypothetical protein n=1 Tax=Streptomyces thermolineatus TaxID=44033 RepID=UPI0038500A83